jgi:hypothetical protein
MSFEKRSRSPLPSPGPFLAEVTNHLDPTYTGCLEVSLLKGTPNSTKFNIEATEYSPRTLSSPSK